MASHSSPETQTVNNGILMDRSKSVVPPKLYDVFINNRGPDVKATLAYDLYNYLQERRCRAFLDSEEIDTGDNISSTLRAAIRSSSVQIAIFSKRYAESPWCLAELVLMLEAETEFNAKFIPIFYEVEPSDLRHVRKGKGVYAEAFARYESLGRYPDNIDMWKTALEKASYISGYKLERDSQYHAICSKIVSSVQREVERRKPLHVSKYSVGLEELVADFENQCGQKGEEKNVKIVGISGMGGSGKTTLAKELFNRKRSNYNASCFVGDVRESSNKGELVSLQMKIIKDLFNEANLSFQNISEGIAHLRYRLKSGIDSSFLIVLDDIDDGDQIDSLLCIDALGFHSLVIITTRNKSVLERARIPVHYNMKEMEESKARELFCWHAFREPNIVEGYEDLVRRFVRPCQGLPLSLKVLGGLVSGCSDKKKWQQVIDRVEKVLPLKLKKIFEISFEGLDREEREIFLDTACFFVGKARSMALRIWKGSGLSAELAVQSLEDKCLVEVGYDKGYAYGDLVIRMHDHVRDMGREIADQLSHPRRLWTPKFLKSLESKGFQKILTETNGRCFHSYFDQSIGCKLTFFVRESDAGAERSTALLLWLQIDFKEGQLESIPSWVPLESLQFLKIVVGRVKRLWREEGSGSSSIVQLIWSSLTSIIKTSKRSKYQRDAEVPTELKELLLETTVLEEFPNNLGKLIYLENLSLKGKHSTICKTMFPRNVMLIEGRSFSESLRKLTNLRNLVLGDLCLSGELDLTNGKDATEFGFPLASCMSHLQDIYIRGVKLTSKISICGENCPSLESLRLDSLQNLAEVHLSKVTTLNNVKLMFCPKLKTVSGSFLLGNLESLGIKACEELEEIPNLSGLSSLERIIIDDCQKLRSIHGIEDLVALKYLYLSTGDGGSGVWNCIQRLKRLPSESATVIGRAVDGAESKLNASFFSDFVSSDAVTEIFPTRETRERETSVKMPNSLSAVIIIALVQSSCGGEIRTPISCGGSLSPGKRIVTMVLTGQKRIYRYHNPDFIFSLFHAELMKKYVVTVNKREECNALDILKKITAQLYQGNP